LGHTIHILKASDNFKEYNLLQDSFSWGRVKMSSSAEHLVIDLCNAVCAAKKDEVRTLIKAGADPSFCRSTDGRAAYHLAACDDQGDILKIIIKLEKSKRRKKSLEARVASGHRDAGKTSLRIAAENRNASAVRILVKNGANVDDRLAGRSPTALWEVIADNIKQGQVASEEVALVLLQAHAKISIRNGDNETILHLLAGLRRSAAVAWITKLYSHGRKAVTAMLEAKDARGCRPLYVAIYNQNADVAQELLKINANPNATGPNGETPIIRSIEMRNMRLLLMLLKKVNHPQELGSAFKVALTKEHFSAAWALLGKGVNIDGNTGDHETPLHEAINRNADGVVTWLISNGANVDPSTAGQNGRTPLKLAQDTNRRIYNIMQSALKAETEGRHCEYHVGLVCKCGKLACLHSECTIAARTHTCK
jgi:ankyrin repeat protein